MNDLNLLSPTELQPDTTIYSSSAKKVILFELTCPCEENIKKWHDRKINKYLPLQSDEKLGIRKDIYMLLK